MLSCSDKAPPWCKCGVSLSMYQKSLLCLPVIRFDRRFVLYVGGRTERIGVSILRLGDHNAP